MEEKSTITGIHFILTYTCNFECDHCFLYCSPKSTGTFTLNQVKQVIKDLKKIKSVNSVCFEGGESFLFYPLLLESVRFAAKEGFEVAIETNCYWATSEEDAEIWLQPLYESGLSIIEVSDDAFHHKEEINNSAKRAKAAAERIGLNVNSLCIDKPKIIAETTQERGEPIYGGGPKMRGRAAEKLTVGLPTKPWTTFQECPFEDFNNPKRVHLDSFGNVHICQGISMGNIWDKPLSELIKDYDPKNNPVCGPILKGGPVQLAKEHRVNHKDEYVDACHLCTDICSSLIDKYPEIITPKQVYGFDQD